MSKLIYADLGSMKVNETFPGAHHLTFRNEHKFIIEKSSRTHDFSRYTVDNNITHLGLDFAMLTMKR